MKKEKGKERKVSLFIILGVRDIIGTRNSEEVSQIRRSKSKKEANTTTHSASEESEPIWCFPNRINLYSLVILRLLHGSPSSLSHYSQPCRILFPLR